jgi:hypothetical protein
MTITNIADIKWDKPYDVESKESTDFLDKRTYKRMYLATIVREGDVVVEMFTEYYNQFEEDVDLEDMIGGEDSIEFCQYHIDWGLVIITESVGERKE